MNDLARRRQRWRNRLQTLLLIGGMILLLAACGWLVAGWQGLWLAAFFGALGLAWLNAVSPDLVLRLFGAKSLPREGLEPLERVTGLLATRAGLTRPPRLYYFESAMLNAFSTGRGEQAAIVMTSGLLRRLDLRELTGILAHEISHIRNDDMRVMGLADVVSRLTRGLSFLGLLLLFLNLPAVASGQVIVPWPLVLLLVFAPALGTLLQLALSRTREYDADLDAAALTGDPEGLALALQKLERYQGRFWEDIVLPGRRSPDPSVLRSHPPTEERVKRLLSLRLPSGERERLDLDHEATGHHSVIPDSPRAPRWRRSGLWY